MSEKLPLFSLFFMRANAKKKRKSWRFSVKIMVLDYAQKKDHFSRLFLCSHVFSETVLFLGVYNIYIYIFSTKLNSISIQFFVVKLFSLFYIWFIRKKFLSRLLKLQSLNKLFNFKIQLKIFISHCPLRIYLIFLTYPIVIEWKNTRWTTCCSHYLRWKENSYRIS